MGSMQKMVINYGSRKGYRVSTRVLTVLIAQPYGYLTKETKLPDDTPVLLVQRIDQVGRTAREVR